MAVDDRRKARREAENRRRIEKGLPPIGKWGGRRANAGRRAQNDPQPKTDDGAGAGAFGLSRPQFARAMQEIADRLNPPAGASIRQQPVFSIARHPPMAMPPAGMEMAADSALAENINWAATEWVNSLGGGLTVDSVMFPGFPALAEYAQRPEFRVISETIAGDMTRKWIDFNVTGDERRREKDPVGEAERSADPDERRKRLKAVGKLDKVKAIKDEMDRLAVRGNFYNLARDDGFFGRSHLFLDFGYGMDSDELAIPVGTGRDALSLSKMGKGSLRGLRTLEAAWVYPQSFNAVNPFDISWYNPQSWYVQGRHVSGSRLLTFVGRPVPDFIKPAYSFGGLSLSQLVKPYVDNWLRTRTAVSSIIHSFSVMVLMTDLQAILADSGSALMGRVALFNMLRDNQGCFVVNKNTEDFKNVSAPLGGLHELQAQSQEHMSSVSRIPLVKLTGIQPAGLNASSEGEIKVYDDTIADYQNRFFRPNLTRVIDFIQLSLFGEVDHEITFEFEPLRELTEKERSEKDKADAERHEKYVNMGAIDPGEVRKVIVEDPTLPYTALDPDDVPDLPVDSDEHMMFGPDDGGNDDEGESAEEFNKDKGKQAQVQTGDALDEILERLCGGDMIRLPTLLTVPGDGRAEPRMVVLSLDRLDKKTNTLHATLEAMAIDDAAAWHESDHPRDKSGKFATGSGGGAAGAGGGAPSPKTVTAPKTEATPETETKAAVAAKPAPAQGSKVEMPDIPERLRRQPKTGTATPTVGTGGAASKLYKPTTESADSVVAKVPGAREAIDVVMEKMGKAVSTDRPPSEGGFKNEDGSYTAERQAIHQKILSLIFTPEAIARAKPAPGEKPTLTILGGRGGSGKSWITKEHGPVDASKSILLDSDWIKGQLPEYQGWNANIVHEESSDIVLQADQIARAAGVNVIHDSSVAKRVATFESAGYELEGYYMYCPPEIAAQRALSRFKTRKGDFSGRFVPPEVILGNTQNEANFDKLSGGMKRWAIYDNSTAEGPRLVSKSWKDDE